MKILGLVKRQELVKQGLESLSIRMKEMENINRRDFIRLALNCKYKHEFKNHAHDECKKIEAPGLYNCSIENCPYLRQKEKFI
jgi:hypothetical protein